MLNPIFKMRLPLLLVSQRAFLPDTVHKWQRAAVGALRHTTAAARYKYLDWESVKKWQVTEPGSHQSLREALGVSELEGGLRGTG